MVNDTIKERKITCIRGQIYGTYETHLRRGYKASPDDRAHLNSTSRLFSLALFPLLTMHLC